MSSHRLHHHDGTPIAQPTSRRDGRRSAGLMLSVRSHSRDRAFRQESRGRPELEHPLAASENVERNAILDSEVRHGIQPKHAATHGQPLRTPRVLRGTRQATAIVGRNATYVSARSGPISLFSRRSASETILAGGLPVGALA